MCAVCTGSRVSGCGECTDRILRMYARLSVRGCCASLWCSWLSSDNYISPEVYLYRQPTSSAESVRFRSALMVHFKNWICSPLEVICTEWTSAPAIAGNHDARLVGTTATALASHLYTPTLLPLRTVVGKVAGYVVHVVVEYVYPGCVIRLKP